MFALAAARANILMNITIISIIFFQKIEIINITDNLTINFINFNNFQYKNIKNMHFLYLKFSSVLTV